MLKPLPPQPPGRWLLGHFREVMADKLGTMTRYARQHGDVIRLRLGPQRILFVNHPELIEEVLVTRARSFHKGIIEQLIRPAAGNGIFLSEGDYWKRQRRMVSPPFHKARLVAYGEIMVDTAERISGSWRDGETRDVYTDMTRLALAIAAKTMFDADVEGEAARFGDVLGELMRCVKVRVDSVVPWPDSVPTPNMLRLRRARGRLDTILHRAIAERRARPAAREDLLSLLLEVRDEDDGKGMSDEALRDEAMTLFIAGFETTAINLSWALYLLATKPEVQERLRGDVERALGGRRPAAGDLPQLKPVEHVVNEALRLYPPAWATDRRALEDMELGGYHVPAGSDIWMLPWVMHRDPRFWERPDDFVPERWSQPTTRPKFAFFPFGGGPRICVGYGFAMMESQLVLARLLQRFRFSVDENTPPPTPEAGFTLRPAPGVRLRLQSVTGPAN